MKIIQEGNVYRRVGLFKENEFGIYVFGCVVVGFLCIVLAVLIGV